MVHSDILIFYSVIRITLKVPSIRILLSIGSLNGKNRLSEGHPRFLSNFPVVNLQMKSISYKVVHSINEKKLDILKICILG